MVGYKSTTDFRRIKNKDARHQFKQPSEREV